MLAGQRTTQGEGLPNGTIGPGMQAGGCGGIDLAVAAKRPQMQVAVTSVGDAVKFEPKVGGCCFDNFNIATS